MKKTTTLKLRAETIRVLDSKMLAKAGGGMMRQTHVSECDECVGTLEECDPGDGAPTGKCVFGTKP